MYIIHRKLGKNPNDTLPKHYLNTKDDSYGSYEDQNIWQLFKKVSAKS